MPKFESCTIDLFYHQMINFSASGWKQLRLNRDKNFGDQSDDDAMARIIAQLGLEGWELVGGASAQGRSERSVFFQRRIS